MSTIPLRDMNPEPQLPESVARQDSEVVASQKLEYRLRAVIIAFGSAVDCRSMVADGALYHGIPKRLLRLLADAISHCGSQAIFSSRGFLSRLRGPTLSRILIATRSALTKGTRPLVRLARRIPFDQVESCSTETKHTPYWIRGFSRQRLPSQI
jgi:hypothetical protein